MGVQVLLQGGSVGGSVREDEGVEVALLLVLRFGLSRGHAFGFGDELCLLGDKLPAGDAGARQHDDEGNVFVARSDHRSDEGAFTVAEETDLPDFGPGLEEGDAGLDIGGEVGCGGRGEGAG